MNRRHWLLGGAAVAATAAGVCVAGWRERRHPASSDPVDALWGLALERPQGGEQLRLMALRGRPLLVNFWATWCAPCVAELPMLDRFAQAHPQWEVVGLAIDKADAVRKFLAEHAVSYRIGLTGAEGLELVRRLGNPSGGLPFSLVLRRDGTVSERKLGALDAADLRDWNERSS